MNKTKPLIRTFESVDPTTLDDLFLCIAATIEDSLRQNGAEAGKDYTILDLYKLAQPFVLSTYKNSDRNLTFTVGYPQGYER